MPELPEVETTRRCLAPALEGARIIAVQIGRPRMVRRQANPADFARRTEGQRVESLRRHGKFLLAELDNGMIWVTHLGMSGRLSLVDHGAPAARHTNVIVTLDSGTELRFIDPRTFGFVAAFTPQELAESSLGRLGRDAFTDLPKSKDLADMLAGRHAPMKALLLDQSLLAGIGNIYADESLHRAGISPLRPGGSLQVEEISALRQAIRQTLHHALRWGGTSLDDLAYLLPDGRSGDYLRRLRAYGREGEPCPRCGGEIVRSVVRNRSAFWCPSCQR
jgi:formamidopyrimidine-DNA glycosylase